MRRRLAIAWLLGITCAVSQAADGPDVSATNIDTPRIFQPERIKSHAPQKRTPKRVFDLKATAPGNDNFLEVRDPPKDDPATDDDEREPSSGIAKVQHTEPFQDEQLESVFPPPSPSAKQSSKEAIRIDGALRDNGEADEKDDEYKFYGNHTSFAWIGGSRDRLGILELDSKPSSRVWFDPLQKRQNDGFLDVEWGAKWLNGPSTTDLPPYLFNVLINVGNRFQINDHMTIDAMISPGWFTDFSNKGVQAFRLPWHLVSYHQMSDDWHGVLGVTDLARDDIHYLPVVGMVFAPVDGDVRLDLVFPKPRIAWRIVSENDGPKVKHNESTGEFKDVCSLWLTLGGELGGGSYAISREDRAYDVVTYRDYRLVAGLETRWKNGGATRTEAGWIFNRAVDYRSGLGNYSPGDSFMIRVSSDF
jgi:hypothetical protein